MLRATLYSSSLSVLPTFALFQHCKLFLFIIAIVTILHCLCLRLDVTTVHDDCQVYLSTSVEDVPLTVSKFAACIADIKAWLRTCRLRLNAAKTQLLWLGSSQLLDKVDCHDVWCSALASPSRTPLAISVLSSTVSCRWQPTSRPSVAPGTISYASSDQ